jgi:hypothetical protein
VLSVDRTWCLQITRSEVSYKTYVRPSACDKIPDATEDVGIRKCHKVGGWDHC